MAGRAWRSFDATVVLSAWLIVNRVVLGIGAAGGTTWLGKSSQC